MKAGAYFAAATAGLIILGYPLLRLGFNSGPDARAIRTSAVIALVVQLVTFAIARRSAKTNLMAGWGIGAMLRVLVVVMYALLVIPSLGLARSAALISLVSFLFASMLVEPLLLAYDR